MKLTLNAFVSLDGVMQGPGGPDEDHSGGFDRGGWVVPFVDEELRDPAWRNSSVIAGNVVAAVEQVEAKPGGALQVHGSCTLAHTLHDAGLVDEYRLIAFPVVVGQGKRLFPDGSVPGTLTLLRSTTTSRGAVALTLQPAGVLGRGDISVVDGKEFIHDA